MPECECFRAWSAALENDEDTWALRLVDSGMYWRNAATRRFTGLTANPVPWDDAARNFAWQDVSKVESAHSLALKTGQPQSFCCRCRTGPAEVVLVELAAMRARCPYGNDCGVIVLYGGLCPEAEPSECE